MFFHHAPTVLDMSMSESWPVAAVGAPARRGERVPDGTDIMSLKNVAGVDVTTILQELIAGHPSLGQVAEFLILLFGTEAQLSHLIEVDQIPQHLERGPIRDVARTFDKLNSAGVLAAGLPQGPIFLEASAFLVAKDLVPKLNARPVFNLRGLNDMLKDAPPFSSFSVSHMLKTIAMLRLRAGRVYLVSADYSNFYYQIRLPAYLQACMVLRAAGEVWTLLVLPMGFGLACHAAQSLTLAVVAFRFPHENSLHFPQKLACEGIPGCVELDSGRGLLFVIYDSILLAVDSAQLAAQWRARIERNSKHFNIILKYAYVSAEGQVLNYAGVDFVTDREKLQFRIAESTFDAWQESTHFPMPATPRTLWRLLGFLRRAAEIQLRPARSLRPLAVVQAKLAREHLIDVPWDEVLLQEETLQLGVSFVLELRNPWLNAASSHMVGVERVFYVVVDATLKHVGLCRLEVEQASEIRGSRRTLLYPVEVIAVGEAFAISWGLSCLNGEVMLTPRDLVFLAQDNTVAGSVYAKGYSLVDALDSVILEGVNCAAKVVIVDIPSDLNLADIPSRPEEAFSVEDEAFRLRSTFNACVQAHSAFQVWPVFYVQRTL